MRDDHPTLRVYDENGYYLGTCAEVRARLAMPSRAVPRWTPGDIPRNGARSPTRILLVGAAQFARGRGARFRHSQLVARLSPGLEVLGYGLALVAAASGGPDRWSSLAANVIFQTGEAVWSRAQASEEGHREASEEGVRRERAGPTLRVVK